MFHDPLDRRDHVWNVLRGPGLQLRPEAVEGIHVLVKCVDVGLGKVAWVHAALLGPLDDLVIDVGEVAAVGDVEAGRTLQGGVGEYLCCRWRVMLRQ